MNEFRRDRISVWKETVHFRTQSARLLEGVNASLSPEHQLNAGAFSDLSAVAELKKQYMLRLASESSEFYSQAQYESLVQAICIVLSRVIRDGSSVFALIPTHCGGGALQLPENSSLELLTVLQKWTDGDLMLTTQLAADGVCLEQTPYDKDGRYTGVDSLEWRAWGRFAVQMDTG